MRLYSFVNYYLSPLQHGLQTAHCVSEMMVDPSISTSLIKHTMFDDWARNHKTIIICNGGNSLQLQELYEKLVTLCDHFKFPVVKFHEDEQSLNCALTSVAVVLPERVYNTKMTDPTTWTYPGDGSDATPVNFTEGSKEFELISLIKSYRLA